MRTIYWEWAVKKLRGDDERDEWVAGHMIFDSKEHAARALVELTGEDHELDWARWDACLRRIGATALGQRLRQLNEESRMAKERAFNERGKSKSKGPGVVE